MRARDAGLFADPGSTGPHDAITDVLGVLVGHATVRVVAHALRTDRVAVIAVRVAGALR